MTVWVRMTPVTAFSLCVSSASNVAVLRTRTFSRKFQSAAMWWHSCTSGSCDTSSRNAGEFFRPVDQHIDESQQVETERTRRQPRVPAGDDAALHQLANSFVDRGNREPDHAAELGMGEMPIVLQSFENRSIDIVQRLRVSPAEVRLTAHRFPQALSPDCLSTLRDSRSRIRARPHGSTSWIRSSRIDYAGAGSGAEGPLMRRSHQWSSN